MVDLGVVHTALDYAVSSGAASATFDASRWLVSGNVAGQFTLDGFTIVPSAKILGIWESQGGYVDTLAAVHDARQFGQGQASVGLAISHALPISDDWAFVPYIGGYFDETIESRIGSDTYSLSGSGRVTAGARITTGNSAGLGIDGQIAGVGAKTMSWGARAGLRASF